MYFPIIFQQSALRSAGSLLILREDGCLMLRDVAYIQPRVLQLIQMKLIQYMIPSPLGYEHLPFAQAFTLSPLKIIHLLGHESLYLGLIDDLES